MTAKYDMEKLSDLGYGDGCGMGPVIEMDDAEVLRLADVTGGSVDEIEMARIEEGAAE